MAIFTAISAVVAAVGAGFAFGAAAGVTFAWGAAAIAFGSSIVLSVAGQLLAPKPKIGGLSSYGDGDYTRQFRQPTPERLYVYGECRVSGGIAFIGTSEEDKYLHMIILLADHEIESVGEILINDECIPPDFLDGNGNITAGPYANKVRIIKHYGSTSQEADAQLISEVSTWTNNHRLQGIAYLYVRLEYDRNVFSSGIPNISAYVKGKKILDPRDDVQRYTSNIALIAKDYLTDSRIGFNVLADDLA